VKKRVLITGSGGMLGVDLCQELAESYELYGLDVRRVQPAPAGVKGRPGGPGSPAHETAGGAGRVQGFFECDITDAKKIRDVISNVKPDVVIHAAAMTDVDGCELDKEKAYRINTDGTANVALACKESGAVLIYISTDFVFDGKKRTPYKETDETTPLSVYGDSKLKGEEAVKKDPGRYFILRTSWLYGKHGKNFVDTIAGKAKTEKVLKVVDDQVGSPTYTVDLAEAICALINKVTSHKSQVTSKDCGIYHVSNSGSVSWYEYAKEILKLAGSGTKVIPISSKELNAPAKRPAMSVLDNSKFIEFAGYKLRNWKDALKEYLTQ